VRTAMPSGGDSSAPEADLALGAGYDSTRPGLPPPLPLEVSGLPSTAAPRETPRFSDAASFAAVGRRAVLLLLLLVEAAWLGGLALVVVWALR
jgi:hypothetical protein